MLEVDTRIAGDPAALEGLAGWLTDVLAVGMEALADATAHHRGTLEQGWQGESGAAFRDAAGELTKAGDQLGVLARDSGSRISGLAAALATAHSRMAALRAEAVGMGLVVRDESVLSPVLDLANGSGPRLDELMTSHARVRATRDEILAAWHARLAEEAGVLGANSAYIQGFTEGLVVNGYSTALLAIHAPRMTAGAGQWRDRALAEASAYADCAPATPLGWGENLKMPTNRHKEWRAARTGPVTFGQDVYADLRAGESFEQAMVSEGSAFVTAALVARLVTTAVAGPVGLAGGTVLSIAAAKWMNGAVDNAYELCATRSTPAPPTPRPVSATPAKDAPQRGEERLLAENKPVQGPEPGFSDRSR